MSQDPTRPDAATRAAGDDAPPAGRRGGAPEALSAYARLIGLCGTAGEERFFRAAFSRARPWEHGEIAVGCGEGGEQRARVLEVDADEVLRDALGEEPEPPRPSGGPVPVPAAPAAS
ncbi:hypothetical protein Ssi03_28580 [Sphaerisporangium siamense]|uniref:Uncharacterized protein n=1 Tax=Sphaerisporangium siamense TaxID=795645 RepID=A0A7W7DFK9_9ACTN|nr:hypothetical protein [Sphaerisporangium siamense]MBB4704448.1 hypothetical protein [Sphaerisporangium siamense]GII84868.1 hypothetical protein Ssi03_28580 [Sphaerisporangium siamense]